MDCNSKAIDASNALSLTLNCNNQSSCVTNFIYCPMSTNNSNSDSQCTINVEIEVDINNTNEDQFTLYYSSIYAQTTQLLTVNCNGGQSVCSQSNIYATYASVVNIICDSNFSAYACHSMQIYANNATNVSLTALHKS
jgi:hypothetical protein